MCVGVRGGGVALATCPHQRPSRRLCRATVCPEKPPGQTCLLSGMEGALQGWQGWRDGERRRGKEAPHLYKVFGTIQACGLWQMEAIKGRGLAGAQLTTSGAREEGDTDQDPRLCGKNKQSARRGRSGNLFSCLSEQTWPVSLSHYPSIFLSHVLT